MNYQEFRKTYTYQLAFAPLDVTHLLVSDDLLHVSLRLINGKASGDQ